MIIFKNAGQLEAHLRKQQNAGQTIGFVPTMGALHEGHLSLIRASGEHADITVSSIFVNPTQFNNPADFEKYPITIESDIDQLEGAGCDILFLPSVSEIYPAGFKAKHYALGYLETVLEGAFRPGHYQGVCQVVDILVRIVHPDIMWLGQKDFQQCMVIKKMLELKHYATKIEIGKTIREKDGLAMSSRNMRLNEQERQQALCIFKALSIVKNEIHPGNLASLIAKAENYLTEHGFKVDYVAVANADNLALINDWDGKTPLVVLAAAYLNEVRLIDNFVLDEAV